MRLVVQGPSNRQIADQLVIGEATVRTHVGNVLNKLHLANRVQATLHALREGLTSLDEMDRLSNDDIHLRSCRILGHQLVAFFGVLNGHLRNPQNADTQIHNLLMTDENRPGILMNKWQIPYKSDRCYMQVHELMMVDPTTISPKTKYAEAFRLLRLKKLHALPVIGKEGQLVGIITEKDLLDISPIAVLGAHTMSDLLSAMAVEEAMTRKIITVEEDCPLEEAARTLIDHKIGSLPVMRGDQLVGMVTELDILRAMMDALGGYSEGLRITLRLLEDKGELGAITDGIIQLGGKLMSLSTYWGDDPFKRVISLKVQGVDRDELLMMLEWTIGVQVIDCCESRTESQPGAASPMTNSEVFPIQNLDSKIPWLLDSK